MDKLLVLCTLGRNPQAGIRDFRLRAVQCDEFHVPASWGIRWVYSEKKGAPIFS